MDAAQLEAESGRWLTKAIALGAADKKRLEDLVRARFAKRPDAEELARVRSMLRKLHDRYEVDEDMTKTAYDERVAALKARLRAAEALDDAVAVDRAVALVVDFGRIYTLATPEQRRKIWELCFGEWVLEQGTLIGVTPRVDTAAPLFAAACLQQRSRPDSNRRSRP